MRFYEFNRTLKEDLSADTLRSLMSIIDFEKSRSEKLNASPEISSSRLITLMQNIGYDSFNFNDLSGSYDQSPIIQSMISKPEKNQMIEILQGSDQIDQGTDLTQPETAPDISPADTISPDAMPNMAQPNMAQPDMTQPDITTGLNQTPEETPLSSAPSGPIESPDGTVKTVQSMAKKALKRRQ